MRHNVTNCVSESLCVRSLSQNSQMASNHHTSRLFISELHSWQELSLAQSCRVITKVYKLHLFFFLARALLETVRSYSLEAHTRFINTVCITYAVICAYFFRTHVNESERAYTARGAFQEQCVCSSTAELKWYRIVYKPQDCLLVKDLNGKRNAVELTFSQW